MVKKLKSLVQYLLIIGLTGMLLYFSLGALDDGSDTGKFERLKTAWNASDKFFLIAMVVVTMISHLVRAIRWNMLLKTSGQPAKLAHTFLSLMVGYLVNLVIPRGGEVSRSLNLYKLEAIPVEVSFGTVIVERIIDIIFLVALIMLSFWIEWDKISVFINTINIPAGPDGLGIPRSVYFVLAFVAICLLLLFIFRKNQKLRSFLSGFKKGVFSVFQLQQKVLFLFYSALIWLLYFAASYLVMLAFEQTAVLGMGAVLTIFAISAIAMALPLPGGTGSYHTLVPLGLVTLYQIGKPDAVALVFIFHALQTLTLIISGIISLLVTGWLVRKKV
jgi:hypothetical protein